MIYFAIITLTFLIGFFIGSKSGSYRTAMRAINQIDDMIEKTKSDRDNQK